MICFCGATGFNIGPNITMNNITVNNLMRYTVRLLFMQKMDANLRLTYVLYGDLTWLHGILYQHA